MKNSLLNKGVLLFFIITMIILSSCNTNENSSNSINKNVSSNEDLSSDSENITKSELAVSELYGEINQEYSSSEGIVDLEDIPDYIENLYSATDELMDSGDITYREKGDTYVFVTTSDGMGIFLAPYNEELASGGNKVSFYSIQPNNKKWSENILLHNSYVDKVTDGMSKLPYIDINENLSLKDDEVTIESLKKLSGNSIILWDGHGLYSEAHGSSLVLSVDYTEAVKKKYRDDFNNNRLDKCILNGKEKVAVTPAFFNYYLADNALENSIIYLGTCYSGTDYLKINNENKGDKEKCLSLVLKSKGTKTLFVNSNEILTLYCHDMEFSVLSAMMNNADAKTALEKAKEENGKNDSDNILFKINNLSSHKEPAEVFIVGDDSIKFKMFIETENELIYTDREEQFKYSDDLGHNYDIKFRIPMIMSNSGGAQAINNSIQSKYYQCFDEVSECMENGTSTHYYSIDYDYYLYGDILSILITTAYYNGTKLYDVYNFDISSKKKLDNDSIIKKLSKDKFLIMAEIRNSEKAAYEKEYGDYKSIDSEFYNKQYTATLADENLNNSVLFANNEGLSVVVLEHTLTGQGKSYRIIKL